ncbi:MAG TPA: glycosyltransferase [Candidatus Pacearchaeota archaeon]|nr:glycosyltransferase [Candidatus Pacearchaeota archaeon]
MKHKQNNDLVSIIIPCYHQAQWLKEAIESALNQTYPNIEVIVVNDGSSDNTREIAKQYPIKYIEKENGGVSSARNTGIKEAKGKWVLTLDADDKIDSTFVEKTIGKNDIVSTTQQTFGDESRLWTPYFLNPTLDLEIENNYLNCCSLFKREIWETIGGYDEKMKDGYEDWDFWIRAMIAGYKATIIPEPLFFYRKHGVSLINTAIAKHQELRDYMMNKYHYL